MYSITF